MAKLSLALVVLLVLPFALAIDTSLATISAAAISAATISTASINTASDSAIPPSATKTSTPAPVSNSPISNTPVLPATTAPTGPRPPTSTINSIPTQDSYGYGSPDNTILQNIAAVGLYLQIPFGVAKFSAVASILADPTANLTFFAPEDSALSRSVGAGEFNFTKTQNATNILQYHIIFNAISSVSLSPGSLVIQKTAFNNQTYINLGPSNPPQVLAISNAGGTLEIQTGVTYAKVVRADIKCTNGYLQIIDQVLIPPVSALSLLASTPDLSIMNNVLSLGNVTGAVSGQGITIFAPTNEAWTEWNYAAQPPGILNREIKYHVVSGVFYSTDFKDGQVLPALSNQFLMISVTSNGTILVNGIRVTQTNVLTSNGVIHIIPGVLDFTKTSNVNMSFTTRYLGTAPVITGQSAATKKMFGEGVLASLWVIIIVATVVGRLV